MTSLPWTGYVTGSVSPHASPFGERLDSETSPRFQIPEIDGHPITERMIDVAPSECEHTVQPVRIAALTRPPTPIATRGVRNAGSRRCPLIAGSSPRPGASGTANENVWWRSARRV